jgi:hypothetical protein
MTDLKVSASIGMQARHRMPPLQFWGILRLLTEFWWSPLSTQLNKLEHRGG